MNKWRKRFISIVCMVLVVLMILSITVMVVSSAGSISAYAASSSSIQKEIDELNSKKSDIEKQIEELKAQIAGLDEQRTTVLERKALLDQKNALAQQELDVIQEQIEIIDNLIDNQRRDLDEAIREEENQRERFLSRLREMEETSSLSYVEVLFKAGSFSDLLTRIDLVNEVMEYDNNLVADYLAARENVEFLEAQSEEMFAVNEENKASLEYKKAELEASIDAACQMIADLEADMEGYEYLIELEEKDAAEIEDILVEKAKELAEAKAAEAAAAAARAAAARAAAAAAAGGDVSGSADSSADTTFLWPTSARTVTSYYGNRVHPVYGYVKFHSGIDIGASYGNSIYSAAAGTVITTGYDPDGYGYYVMVMHNNGYTTLYAHMSSVSVSYGQKVSRGQVLGKVGSTGCSTGAHLHFEVRKTSSGGTVNPLSFSYVYS